MDLTKLSGVWSGKYWLEPADHEGVPFSVWLTVDRDRLTGSILEKNIFETCNFPQLESDVRGHVTCDEIVFLKTYRGFDHEPAYYEGTFARGGRQIIGRWYFDWPDEVSGRFEMHFKGAKANIGQAASNVTKLTP
ncbi:MAG: hypothetical protein AAF767_08680 [Pseudomonadota bacterium]